MTIIGSLDRNTVATNVNTSAQAANTAEIKTQTEAINRLAAATELQLEASNANTKQLAIINEKLTELLAKLRNLPDPEQISLTITKEIGTMLQFKITLPTEPADPNDIVGGELTVMVGDAAPVVVATAKGQAEVTGTDAETPFSGNQGDLVSASFVYIDDADNRSPHPSTINGVQLTDTIPPSDPGALGLSVTAEV